MGTYTCTNIFTVGTNRFEAYLNRLAVGQANNYEATFVLAVLDLSRVSNGVLEVTNTLNIGVSANANYHSYVLLSDKFTTTIGTSPARATMAVGDGGAWGTNMFTAGGVFNAYLASLVVGRRAGNASPGLALLDLSGVTNGTLDVSGDMIVATGNLSRATAVVKLPAFTASAANLKIGCADQSGAKGDLYLNGTHFIVTGGVKLDGSSALTNGTIDIQVLGVPAGLDLTSGATLAVSQGVINITFQNVTEGVKNYWGLRWQGDHVAELTALTNASPPKLTWDDSAITHPSAPPVAIYAEGGYTYVGTVLPPRGTVINVR